MLTLVFYAKTRKANPVQRSKVLKARPSDWTWQRTFIVQSLDPPIAQKCWIVERKQTALKHRKYLTRAMLCTRIHWTSTFLLHCLEPLLFFPALHSSSSRPQPPSPSRRHYKPKNKSQETLLAASNRCLKTSPLSDSLLRTLDQPLISTLRATSH